MNAIVESLRRAVKDLAVIRPNLEPLPASVRIDGKTCLVTGANSGLGKAVAIDLAGRGGHVLMACRSGHPDAGEDVRTASGSDCVEMLKVDLSDMHSVHRLCDELRERRTRIDIAVLNAGLMPRRALRTVQGFEAMFAVHFLANRVLVDRWLKDGTLRPSASIQEAPRIVLVSSEAHRSAEPIDFDRLGAFENYGLRDGLRHYGASKLVMSTFAVELSRRLNQDDGGHVAVHSLCPGPVHSAIGRNTPILLKPLIYPVMKLFFLPPARAAAPVSYLCCAGDAGKRSGIYLHMMREKHPSELAVNRSNGAGLWEASEALLHRLAASPETTHERESTRAC